MRGLRQSLAVAATKCGGDLEPHRDCLYVATSRYLDMEGGIEVQDP